MAPNNMRDIFAGGLKSPRAPLTQEAELQLLAPDIGAPRRPCTLLRARVHAETP